jgi:uncharacterized protein (TIGR03435 family)
MSIARQKLWFRFVVAIFTSASGGWAQVPEGATHLQFEVASVKSLSPDEGASNTVRFTPDGFVANGAYLKTLISAAYGVQMWRIDGPPQLFEHPISRDQRLPAYVISAKASGPAPKDRLRQMLQTLLVERFHLKFHKDARTEEVDVLTVSRNGLRIKPTEDPGKAPGVIMLQPYGFEAKDVSMDTLANFLSFRRGVINLTGLEGVYSFTLRAQEDNAMGSFTFSSDRDANVVSALRSIGLDLTRRKMPVEHLVVDSALATPTEN